MDNEASIEGQEKLALSHFANQFSVLGDPCETEKGAKGEPANLLVV